MMSVNLNREEFVKEFAKRTLYNYKSYAGQYEQTQFVNSLIGLLVIPKEISYKNRIIKNKQISADLIEELQCGITEHSLNEMEHDEADLNTIMRHVRNAICHGGIEFRGEYPVLHNDPIKIEKILFTDDYGDEFFQIEISTKTLMEVVKQIFAIE